MQLPVVKFKSIPLHTEIDWIHGFLFQNKWDWGKYIIKKHPSLLQIKSLSKEGEQVTFLRRYITQYRKEHKEDMMRNKVAYQKHWQAIENDYFITISEIMGIKWPHWSIKAMLSINPICPRFLEDRSFSLFYDYPKVSNAMETIMHESCHFLYFEKWKQLYPQMNHKKFEAPYIEWHLSEIVAPIILNDHRIQRLLHQKAFFYKEHKRIQIGHKPVPVYFTNLYNNNAVKIGFEAFLIKAYKEIWSSRELFKY